MSLLLFARDLAGSTLMGGAICPEPSPFPRAKMRLHPTMKESQRDTRDAINFF